MNKFGIIHTFGWGMGGGFINKDWAIAQFCTFLCIKKTFHILKVLYESVYQLQWSNEKYQKNTNGAITDPRHDKH